ncbi:MAG: hypothetical protein FWE02_04035 [Defluviitaleaceae bacterium]|nr:hypothetical protein [Defluviitaleaceae bacterium]
MDYLDKRFAILANKNNKKEKIKKTWEEQLSEMIEDMHNLHIELDREDTVLEQLSLFDGGLNVYMPKGFTKMPMELIKANYVQEEKPQLVYRNKKDTINICLSVIKDGDNIIEESELLLLRDIMKNSFIKLNPSSKILDFGDFFQNEKLIVYYTYPSFALNGQNYNLMFLTLLGSNLLICGLNCLKKDMERMKPFFYGFMNTIEIKEVVPSEVEETMEETEEEQEQVPEQLIFDKDQLLSLPTIATLSIRDYNVFICKNENGETPLNNIYALNENSEFLWSARSFDKCETGEITYKPLPNKNPFISMEQRGLFAIMGLDEVETEKTELGYYVNLSDGKISIKDLQLIRRQHRETIEQELMEEERKKKLEKQKRERMIF